MVQQAKRKGTPPVQPDMYNDPFAPPPRESSEEFEQARPTSAVPPARYPSKGQGERYKVLLASPWRNEHTGQEGTSWTNVGRAFPLKDQTGYIVHIHTNLSVSGTLIIKPDDGND